MLVETYPLALNSVWCQEEGCLPRALLRLQASLEGGIQGRVNKIRWSGGAEGRGGGAECPGTRSALLSVRRDAEAAAEKDV